MKSYTHLMVDLEGSFFTAADLLDNEQFDAARMIYTDLLPTLEGEERARAFALRGFASYQEERFVEAEQDFTFAISLQPGALNTLFLRARCYEELEDPLRALTDYQHILDLAPNTVDAWQNVSYIYRYLGRFKDAENAVEMVERARG